MVRTVRRGFLVSAVATALAAGASGGGTAPPMERGMAAVACSLSFVPDAVTAGRPDTRVLADATEELSGTPTAEAASDSGIEVEGVERDVAPGSWVLELNLAEARPGRWRLTLRHASTECSGRIRIRG